MFRIFRFQLLARIVAVCTALFSTAIYAALHHWVDKEYPLFKIVVLAFTVSFVLALILSFAVTARAILWLYGLFDKTAFPDLSGTWVGSVSLENGASIQIRAVIRQTLDQTQIDVHGATMKSTTLEATPVIEGGQKKLYYVYHCTPRKPDYHCYYGSTLFDIRRVGQGSSAKLALSGRYFTDRKTVGTIELEQSTTDFAADVSFY